jgi:hypothetical protein
MYQHKGERNSSAENYVVRGLNEKLNYFVGENQLFDLEYRVPLQKVVDNPLTGVGLGYNYLNQRKVYWDNSRCLSTHDSNHLFLPMTRMSVTFWKNLIDQGDDVNILKT